MANTYTQIYMHIIFAVARREALISNDWMLALHAYLAGACRNRQHFVHAIGGTADNVHLLLGMHPAESVANLVKELFQKAGIEYNPEYIMRGYAPLVNDGSRT